MSDPKPLTKERREEMLKWDCCACRLEEVVEELLAAEQFWREAVKNNPPIEYDEPHFKACTFCGQTDWKKDTIQHEPDCPWVLAQ